MMTREDLLLAIGVMEQGGDMQITVNGVGCNFSGMAAQELKQYLRTRLLATLKALDAGEKL